MKEVLVWIIDNKDWLFSGIGIVLGAWLVGLFFKKRKAESKNTIRSGKNSTNVIAGGNVEIKAKKKK